MTMVTDGVALTSSDSGCPVIVRPGTRVDVTTVSELRREIHAALELAGPAGVQIDLSNVAILDAAGLGMLVAAHRKAALADSRLTLACVPPGVARVLAVTRLYRVFRLDRAILVGGGYAATAH